MTLHRLHTFTRGADAVVNEAYRNIDEYLEGEFHSHGRGAGEKLREAGAPEPLRRELAHVLRLRNRHVHEAPLTRRELRELTEAYSRARSLSKRGFPLPFVFALAAAAAAALYFMRHFLTAPR